MNEAAEVRQILYDYSENIISIDKAIRQIQSLIIPVVVGSDLKDLKPVCPKCNGNNFSWSLCNDCGYDPFK